MTVEIFPGILFSPLIKTKDYVGNFYYAHRRRERRTVDKSRINLNPETVMSQMRTAIHKILGLTTMVQLSFGNFFYNFASFYIYCIFQHPQRILGGSQNRYLFLNNLIIFLCHC